MNLHTLPSLPSFLQQVLVLRQNPKTGKAKTLISRSLQSREANRAQNEMMGCRSLFLRFLQIDQWKPREGVCFGAKRL